METAIDAVIDCRDFARASNSKPLYLPKTYEELILESMKRFKEYQRQEEACKKLEERLFFFSNSTHKLSTKFFI